MKKTCLAILLVGILITGCASKQNQTNHSSLREDSFSVTSLENTSVSFETSSGSENEESTFSSDQGEIKIDRTSADKLLETWANAYVNCDAEIFLNCFPLEAMKDEFFESYLTYDENIQYWKDKLSSGGRTTEWEVTKVQQYSDDELINLNKYLNKYNLTAEEAYYHVVWFSDDDEWVTVARIGDEWFVISY